MTPAVLVALALVLAGPAPPALGRRPRLRTFPKSSGPTTRP